MQPLVLRILRAVNLHVLKIENVGFSQILSHGKLPFLYFEPHKRENSSTELRTLNLGGIGGGGGNCKCPYIELRIIHVELAHIRI